MQQGIAIGTPSRQSKPLLMLGLALGYFMVLMDTTVVNIALPAIQDDLGGGMEGLEWVVNTYTIVFAGLLLGMGALADKWGAKRIYLGGLFVFLAASGLSAAAPTIGVLIACRAALGVGGAVLMPASLTLLAHAFTGRAERARAMGIWAASTGVAMAAGPVVGGLLVDAAGWRSIFLLQVPLALAGLLVTARYVGETSRNPGRGFDWAGQLSAFAAIAAVSFVLMEGQTYGWLSPLILAVVCAALLSGCVFIRSQSRGRAPMLPLRMFRNPAVSGGMAAGMAINLALAGLLFMLPLYAQRTRELSAGAAGLLLLPMMLPLAFNPILTGRIVGRIGPRVPMSAGFGLTAAGTAALMTLGGEADGALAIAGLLLVGFGVSLTIPSLMTAVISSAAKEQAGAASGALNASRQLGAAVGVAIASMIVTGQSDFAAGMHVVLLAMTAVLIGGGLLSLAFIKEERRGD